MKITARECNYIAHLARLHFSSDEFRILTSQLNRILEHFESIAEIETGDVEPLGHPGAPSGDLRADDPRPCLSLPDVLGNAPDSQGGFFNVPRIIED